MPTLKSIDFSVEDDSQTEDMRYDFRLAYAIARREILTDGTTSFFIRLYE